MAYRLRPYQQRAADAIEAHWASGVQRVLAVSPTASGKTILASSIIRNHALAGERILFLAHRKELIVQTSRKLRDADVTHGVMLAGYGPRNKRLLPVDPSSPVQVASLQTYARREQRPFDLIVVDEAHRVRARTYMQILEANPLALVLLLTATPWRTDGRGMAEVADELVLVARVRELIDLGALVPYKGFAFDAPELDGCRLKRGEISDADAARIMAPKVIVGSIVANWAEHASDRRTVCFAASVERSMELVREINNLRHHGGPVVHAEHVDGFTPADIRDGLLDPDSGRLASGETGFVSNVGVLSDGVDVPAIEAIILARPTCSTAFAIQCMGRGFRPCPETGKVDLLIHDHAGVTLMHGLPDEERNYSLTADSPRVRLDERSSNVSVCRNCFEVMPRSRSVCDTCGQRRKGRMLEAVDATGRVALMGPT